MLLFQPNTLIAAFDWWDAYKSGASFFYGSSPEFELAAYTLCFKARSNSQCMLSMDGNDVTIQTYTNSNADFETVGTAYPAC